MSLNSSIFIKSHHVSGVFKLLETEKDTYLNV